MNINKEQVIEILKSVIHPEKGKDIVTLDFVKDLEVGNNKISFKKTRTTCLFGAANRQNYKGGSKYLIVKHGGGSFKA